MGYQVLAQKYRPQTFDDVIGQDAVIRTLKNSIQNERVANAYIFSGPRGVGKTSIARLVSKTLNCMASDIQKPCNKCDSCMEIAASINIDVLEIDGASNNGVDEIRALRENVKFSPSKGRYKIYIIDEVHMLSSGAFNALLKTLEEPPAHVKFIFATTEPHKVLPTIMSRCQKFDFKRIAPVKILKSVLDVAKKEKIDIDEKAAVLISRSADGSLRDALVVLDQMISFSGKKILADDVIDLLGMVHRDSIFKLAGFVVENNAADAARMLDGMINDGKDPIFITNSLIEHYRDLMILKTAGEPLADMAFTKEEFAVLKDQNDKLSLEEILYILQNLTHCLQLMKGTMFVRAPLEITLIRLTKRGAIMRLSEVVERLESMKNNCGYDVLTKDNVQKNKSTETDIDTEEPGLSSNEDLVEENSVNEVSNGAVKSVENQWKSVLNYIRKKKESVYTFLIPASPVEFNNKNVVISFGEENKFYKEVMESGSNKSLVQEAVNKVMGVDLNIKFVVREDLDGTKETKEAQVEKKMKSSEEMKPVIEKAMDVFGGHVVRDMMEDN